MALNTLPAGAFADDAITSDKINLANTFAFTGTVTGVPSDFELLNTVTVSSNLTSVDWGSTYITDTHKIYILYFKNMNLGATDNFAVRVGSDGVISSGSYQKGGFADSFESTSYGGISGTSDTMFPFGGHHENTAAGSPMSGQVTFYNMREAKNKHMIMQDVRIGTGANRFDVKGCILPTTAVYNTIRFLSAGGNNFDSGQLSLYGLRT
jgi:hypothetical protein